MALQTPTYDVNNPPPRPGLAAPPKGPAQPAPQPKPQPGGADPAATMQPQAPLTFAQMQAQGQARPVPMPPMMPAAVPALNPGGANVPTPAAGVGAMGASGVPLPPFSTTPAFAQPAAGGAGAGGGLSNQLSDAVSKMLGTPTAYDNKAMMDEFMTMGGQIDDQFSAQEANIGEELAKRGLGGQYDGTYGVGRLRDSQIGQRNAKAQLASDLSSKRATAHDQGLNNAISQALGLETSRSGADLENRKLSQQESQFGRELGLEGKKFDLAKENQAFEQNLNTQKLDLDKKVQDGVMSRADADRELQRYEISERTRINEAQMKADAEDRSTKNKLASDSLAYEGSRDTANRAQQKSQYDRSQTADESAQAWRQQFDEKSFDVNSLMDFLRTMFGGEIYGPAAGGPVT